MRHGTSNRRPRNRGNGGNNNGRRGNQPRTKVYDSNGPDVRIRGTAHQVAEKYMTLAKDASSMGELILAESYLQHAEHYQRLINAQMVEAGANTQQSTQNSDKEAPKENKEKTYSKGNEKDDLALPASILGGEVKVEAEGVAAAVASKSKAAEVSDTVE